MEQDVLAIAVDEIRHSRAHGARCINQPGGGEERSAMAQQYSTVGDIEIKLGVWLDTDPGKAGDQLDSGPNASKAPEMAVPLRSTIRRVAISPIAATYPSRVPTF